MRLTAFSDVSLRIMMLLSGAEGHQLSTQAIAEGVGTPYHHVTKSVAFLAHQGWVLSSRGRAGGVKLSEEGRKVTIGQLLRHTERDSPIVECEGAKSSCLLNTECDVRVHLARARQAFYEVLDPVVISSLPTQKQLQPVFIQLGLSPSGKG
ncbi:RrF2 family transcriptional regulator [Rothia sp. P6271]|uniref:RrF2 family transcriptional regulator n=1 Tax=Rothia sp. P6271 TaxID=3402659 RepID=UPI003AD2299A